MSSLDMTYEKFTLEKVAFKNKQTNKKTNKKTERKRKFHPADTGDRRRRRRRRNK